MSLNHSEGYCLKCAQSTSASAITAPKKQGEAEEGMSGAHGNLSK